MPSIKLVAMIIVKNMLWSTQFEERIKREMYKGNVKYNNRLDFPESDERNLWL